MVKGGQLALLTNRLLRSHRYSVGTKHNCFFFSIEPNDRCDLIVGKSKILRPARIDGQQLIVFAWNLWRRHFVSDVFTFSEGDLNYKQRKEKRMFLLYL